MRTLGFFNWFSRISLYVLKNIAIYQKTQENLIYDSVNSITIGKLYHVRKLILCGE